MPKNYSLDDILNEYSGKEDTKTVKSNQTYDKADTGRVHDTGFIKIPKNGTVPDNTTTYSIDELTEEIPYKRPAPSHASGKFQISDVSRPNVSYINSVKDVVKKPADLPPRAADSIKDYDGAVVTKTSSDKEYTPKVRKMSDSTRAKEMRSRRRNKKKKQPEFTYERETPDGVYTRPQKKNKKFVVTHEEGKKKKPDKMAPVSLSAETDPELLDIALDNTSESHPRPESEAMGKEETIRDYDSYEDAKAIKRSIAELKSSLSIRFSVLMLLFVFSAYMSAGEALNLPIPGMLSPKNTSSFSIVQLIIIFLSMLISVDTVKSGLLNLLRFKADTDSLAAFGALASAAAAISFIADPVQAAAGGIYLYTPVAIMTLLINTLGKRLILKRAYINFDFTVRERNKCAIFCVEDDIRAESLTRGTIGDFPILASMKKTSFLKDFSKYTFSTDSADRLCRALVPIIILMSAIASAGVVIIEHKPIDKTIVSFVLSTFTLYLSACSCMALPLIANIPLEKAAKKYAKNHGILLGYQSVEDYYDANSVMTDANKLFPAGSVSLSSIKLFSDTKIDEALLDAASLTSHADSVLQDLFGDVISGKVMILKKVENFVYEEGMGICGWIDNKRILLGNRELMQSHNIEGVPTKTKESEFTENAKDALYLSVSGNLAAMFIIDISPSPAVKKAMKKLEKYDMAVIIKTIDHFITINRVSQIYGFPEDLLKIVPTGMMKDYDEETKKVRKTSTSLVCSEKFGSFVNMLMSVKFIKRTVSSGIILQSVSALLGLGIVTLGCVLTNFADLTPGWIITYNLVCTLLTAFFVGIKRI